MGARTLTPKGMMRQAKAKAAVRKPAVLPAIGNERQILLSIDPGTKYLGFSVIAFSPDSDDIEYLQWGTLYGKGEGMQIAHSLVNSIDEIITDHAVTLLAIENYQFLPGKMKGMFVVPMLIGILKYHWYNRSGREAIMLPSQSWKAFITGKPGGNKADVFECIQRFLPDGMFDGILDIYKDTRGERTTDVGQQDCLDALGIGLYVSSEFIRQNRQHIDAILPKRTRRAK